MLIWNPDEPRSAGVIPDIVAISMLAGLGSGTVYVFGAGCATNWPLGWRFRRLSDLMLPRHAHTAIGARLVLGSTRKFGN